MIRNKIKMIIYNKFLKKKINQKDQLFLHKFMEIIIKNKIIFRNLYPNQNNKDKKLNQKYSKI